MHMKLADDIAQCGDIHFIGSKTVLEVFGQGCGFFPELRLIAVIQLKQFTDISATRHQNKPGIVGVLAQQQPTKRKVPKHISVFLKTWIQIKHRVSPTTV
ncbi:hypothetical protein D3C76_1332280 [compost metagenome]